jgi:hypothetical protein
MLAYTPKKNKYLGDDKFRSYTKLGKAKRARSPVPPPPVAVAEDGTVTAAGVTVDALKSHSDGIRLSCGFIGELTEHFNSCTAMEEQNGKKLKCVFCGKPSYQFCGLCGVAVHKFPKDGVGDGTTSCFFLYHDAGCFGLARDDWKITNKKMKDWTFPTATDRKANELQMKRLSDHLARSTAPATGGGRDNGTTATPAGGGRDNGGAAGGDSFTDSSDSDVN